MVYEIYAYWNTTELAAMFNAVAALMGSGDFNGLMRSVAIIGIISVVISTLAMRGDLMEQWKWLFFLLIFQGALVVPKTNVLIVDRTGSSPPSSVANVPIGMALFGHSVSKIGDWLTESYETVFALPNDVQFRKNGSLFGHQVLAELAAVKANNPILTTNLLEFYRECVAPELSSGYIDARVDIAEASDIWGALNGKVNPSRLVTLRDLSDPAATTTYGCQAGYSALTTQITAEANKQLSILGQKLYPSMTKAMADAAIAGSVATTSNYILGVSTTGVNAVKQSMVSNFMMDAQYLLPAQLGDAASASTNYGMARAATAYREEARQERKTAQALLPKARTVIELIQYAIFPIVVLFTILAGPGAISVVKAYVMSLFWIQLWAPLWAVLHYVYTLKLASAAADMAKATATDLSMASVNGYLTPMLASDFDVAAKLSLAIPMIAWVIVKGASDGGSGAAGKFFSKNSPHANTSLADGSGASMGTNSVNTTSTNTHSANSMSTAPTINQGGLNYTDRGGWQNKTSADGSMGTVEQPTSSLRAAPTLDSMVSGAAKQGYEKATAAELQAGKDYAEATAAAFQQSADYMQSHGRTRQDGNTWGHGIGSNNGQELSETRQQARNWASKLGISEKEALEMGVYASGDMNLGAAGIAKFSAGLTGNFKNASERSRAVEQALSEMRQSGFGKKISNAVDSSWKRAYSDTDASTTSGSAGLRAALDQSKKAGESLRAAKKESESYKQTMELAESGSLRNRLNLTDDFNQWVSQRMDFNAPKIRAALNDVVSTQKLAEEYQKERMPVMLEQYVNSMKGEGDVKVAGDKFAAQVPGQNNVKADGQGKIAAVKGSAGKGGVNPTSGVSDQAMHDAMRVYSSDSWKLDAAGKDATGRPDRTIKEFKPETITGNMVKHGGEALDGLRDKVVSGEVLDAAKGASTTAYQAIGVLTGGSLPKQGANTPTPAPVDNYIPQPSRDLHETPSPASTPSAPAKASAPASAETTVQATRQGPEASERLTPVNKEPRVERHGAPRLGSDSPSASVQPVQQEKQGRDVHEQRPVSQPKTPAGSSAPQEVKATKEGKGSGTFAPGSTQGESKLGGGMPVQNHQPTTEKQVQVVQQAPSPAPAHDSAPVAHAPHSNGGGSVFDANTSYSQIGPQAKTGGGNSWGPPRHNQAPVAPTSNEKKVSESGGPSGGR